jgi:hypothetical protein
MSILILSSHLRLGLPKGIFPVGLLAKILKTLLPSSILATCPANLNIIDLIILTILCERYEIWSSSLWSLLHPILDGNNTKEKSIFFIRMNSKNKTSNWPMLLQYIDFMWGKTYKLHKTGEMLYNNNLCKYSNEKIRNPTLHLAIEIYHNKQKHSKHTNICYTPKQN